MRVYEMMYVIKPDLDEENLTALTDKINGIITDNGGEIVTSDKWGKRRLAYEIKDYREGVYMLVNFKGEPSVPQELDRILKITDDILRFMILNKEEK